VHRIKVTPAIRPIIGGAILIPFGLITPQALSAGHGALNLDLISDLSIQAVTLIILLKIAASSVSLGFGFRGGLFFASLFMGSLVGQIYALLLAAIPGVPQLDPTDAALVGMAAMAVAVVGGPMTMSMLVLEATHDFALTGTVITAALCAGTVARELFGFSFSTWRLHTRGESIRSARDIGWTKTLTAGRMMRRGVPVAEADISLAEFRRRYPLGSGSRVVLADPDGIYVGIVPTAAAFSTASPDAPAPRELAILKHRTLSPDADVAAVMRAFEEEEADDIAVADPEGRLLGLLSEKYVQRRYVAELEKAQRALFGEA
jgi:chloride channel protein, CIC family